VVATPPGGALSSVRAVTPAGAVGKAWTTVHHAPGGDVRAALLPGAQAAVLSARATTRRDHSFDYGLYLAPAGAPATLLCTEVAQASRPLVTASGRLFVTRGLAGPTASPAEYRVDALRIDEVDPASGSSTTVHAFSGYLLHLAGSDGGRLLLYRVGPKGADVVALDPDGGGVKVLIAKLPPFARDFSIDRAGHRLIFRGRHESDPKRWTVEALDLSNGSLVRLYQGGSFSLAPHAWPGGGVALNPRRAGLQLLGSSDRLSAPLGAGVDVVRAFSSSGRFVALLHTVQGALPVAFVIDRASGQARRLPTSAGQRIAIAGFLPAGAGATP